MDNQTCKAAYLAAKRSENLRTNTLRGYEATLSAFCDWIQAQHIYDTDCVTPEVVRRYLAFILESGRADSSASVYRAHILTWLRWLEREGYVDKQDWSTVAQVRCDVPEPMCLTQDEAAALLRAMRRLKYRCTLVYRRNMALVSLLLDSGLRKSEVINVRMADLSLTERAVIVRAESKSRRQRVVYFGAETLRLLRSYLKLRSERFERSPWLFISRDGKRLSQTQVYDLIVRAGRLAGIPRLHPHALRHSFATFAIEADVPLTYVQAALGHASARTTQRYTHVRNEALADRLREASCVDRLEV